MPEDWAETKRMRIQLFSDHRYPADDGHGAGVATRNEPSGAPHRIHDLIARGLGELGHEVLYCPDQGADGPLPPGVTLSTSPREDVDLHHNLEVAGRPWILTQHRTRDVQFAPENWVFVSRSLASLYGRSRFVRNGLDPAEYIYSETKDDYILYLASMQGRAQRHKYQLKGLHVAVSLASELGFKLRVAGTARDEEILGIVMAMCHSANVEFLGDVRGAAKAELLAGARALLFPTQIHEGLPLVIIEALFSGTPVIASHHGPCPEVVPPEVGFICHTTADYSAAIENAHRIKPGDCRERGLRDHHYMTMVRGYLREYEIEAGRYGAAPLAKMRGAS
jgi:glycosyltransferase involved in cell wall biosynthesis